MTRLRKMILEELQRRNFSEDTIRHYIRTVEDFRQRKIAGYPAISAPGRMAPFWKACLRPATNFPRKTRRSTLMKRKNRERDFIHCV